MEFPGPAVGNVLAIALAAGFVATMWLFKEATVLKRDDERTIQNRFRSTLLTSFISIAIVAAVQPNPSLHLSPLREASLWRRLGLGGPVTAVPFVLALNSCLFLGPLTLLHFRGILRPASVARNFWADLRLCWAPTRSLEELQVVRQYFIGPLTEEVVYRMAVCYCLYGSGASQRATLLLSSLYFSLAHGHHLYERVRQERIPWQQAWPPVLFQLTMTFVFGAYSGFVFMATGSLPAAVLLHMHCNYLGPPNLSFRGESFARTVWAAYLVGVGLFWGIVLGVDLGGLCNSPYRHG